MKLIKNILFGLTVACLILAIAAIGIPKLFGIQFRAVMTGSMTPEIPVGSLVVVVPTKAEDIKVGDVITFVKTGDMVVTHKVVSIDREKNEFTTWGIANPKDAVDSPSKYENIIGVVRLHIPVIGRPMDWFSTPSGKIITLTAIVAAFILSAILGIWIKGRNQATDAYTVDSKSGDILPVYATNEGTNADASAPDQANDRTAAQLQKLLNSFQQSETLFGKSDAAAESVPPAQTPNAPAQERTYAITPEDVYSDSKDERIGKRYERLSDYKPKSPQKTPGKFVPKSPEELFNELFPTAGTGQPQNSGPQTYSYNDPDQLLAELDQLIGKPTPPVTPAPSGKKSDPTLDALINDPEFKKIFENDDFFKDLFKNDQGGT